MVMASWAVPAQSYRTVMIEGNGRAVVCDTAWETTCWHCYDSSITGHAGWECFRPWNALSFKPTGAEQQKQRERLKGWAIDYAPKGSNKDVHEVQEDYRKAQARELRSAPGSAKVVAELQKLFPQKGVRPGG